jgi:hypothetical protein
MTTPIACAKRLIRLAEHVPGRDPPRKMALEEVSDLRLSSASMPSSSDVLPGGHA